jgi:hypothetical protein
MNRKGSNNPFFGKTHTPEVRERIRKSKLSEKNPNWKGDDAGYFAIHIWVKARKKSDGFCERCHKKKVLDLANISGEYKRDLDDWEYLCRKCHMEGDGRLSNLKNNKRLEAYESSNN